MIVLCNIRLNFEALNIKQKAYVDSISVCITDVTTFTGDVVRDAMKIMMDDDVLPVALVRTALLASKAHNDVKKYVLNDFIPILIKRKIWVTTPVHWEGLKHCVKNYAVGPPAAQVEPTLRAVLGLPGPQLKSVVAAAPTIKTTLAKLLKVLSATEREDVLSGRWAGLDTTSTSGEIAVLDAEKAKIVKELSAIIEK